jgi:hypothetical protein
MRLNAIIHRLERRWWVLLLIIALLAHGLSIARSFLDVDGFSITLDPKPPLNIDAAIFQHGGWYITQGAAPYIHIWDIKPPLAMETTALLAIISGGNMYRLHLLSVMLTSMAAVGTVMLLGRLAHHMTNSAWGGLAAGLAMIALPGFHYLPALGFRPRYLMLALGFLSIELIRRRRPFWAGVCSAAATGYFLMGLIFPLSVMLIWARQGRPDDWWRPLSGMLSITALVLLPVLLWGAFTPMLVEALLVPLVMGENLSLSTRLARVLEHVRYVVMLVPFGVIGLIHNARQRSADTIWPLLGGVWFAFQVMWLDFDSFPDFFGALAYISLGIGLLVSENVAWLRRGVLGLTSALVLISPIWLGGFGVLFEPFDPPGQNPRSESESRAGLPNMAYYYWYRVQPESCHYRLSVVEREWLERTGQPLIESECERHTWAEIRSFIRSDE